MGEVLLEIHKHLDKASPTHRTRLILDLRLNGNFLLQILLGSFSIDDVEALAVREGLEFALQRHLQSLVMESDSLRTIQAISNPQP
ncbi:hypothetical protein TorRG33x02_177340 [Trema orientale]|uniref:RNase H type-1 domain-containing protein n=1 Tax=Trema orientale TaxID=63057 RepID=A0A2P5ELV8_TREOI|nr:hypothetical protein TorRG33x02_177340 [Trema orientale]